MSKKSILLKLNRTIFSTDDLGLIWNEDNQNTLLTTIKRYTKDGTFYKIRKGLQATKPLEKLDKYLLGTSYVSGFCYVSLQTVLANHGLINQSPNTITLIGSRSLKFKIGETNYSCKKMNPKYLYNSSGIHLSGDFPIATPERAFADMQYYNSLFHLDNNLNINFDKINLIKQKVYHAST